ncbi:16S rRNA (guanine(527)-N(7))-methyltransferase RsmG [Paenibacillus nasutitermitis]|uniref:Ribosomal RNA small subunit methyltransferase G n=1 Tax=Paenibacillus nasutitermitis TaxID=1652958 RepID=A0A917E4G5_9BACL|nr:16S rRNA (guanine(527)-N(7))-methyltransferase RsmG [Paenibacillus nasutitermitis]GGE00577.1 ribosomal RNA small subunit methyltransferase G [Paenibacillus nasutitermitis]
MDQTEKWFSELLHDNGLSITARQLEQFDRYYRLLIEWNEKMNLTGITEREAVYEKHFYDSLTLSFFLDMNKMNNLADIGSGAGFPSIPLKICFPHLKVTIVDSLKKRIHFLQHVVEQLELQDFTCIHGRAEDVARMPGQRDAYDLATARAVARLSALNELCLPFVRSGGLFAAMKGANSDAELQEAGKSLVLLKGQWRETHQLKLPFEQADRNIIIFEKKGTTPGQYPRKAGTPLKQPLV